MIGSELWRAESADGRTVEAGVRIRVRAIEGLTLEVELFE
jgi:membrane protein implicated in regulation of membrane protease activity